MTLIWMVRLINTTELNSLLLRFLALFILLASFSYPVKAANNDEIFQVIRLINQGQYLQATKKLPDIVANTDKVNGWGGPTDRAYYMLYLADVAMDAGDYYLFDWLMQEVRPYLGEFLTKDVKYNEASEYRKKIQYILNYQSLMLLNFRDSDKQHGQGTYTYSNGQIVRGIFANGQFVR